MTSQAFRNALHVPLEDPEAAEVVFTVTSGDLYETQWRDPASGVGFTLLMNPRPPVDGEGIEGDIAIDTQTGVFYGPKAPDDPLWTAALDLALQQDVPAITDAPATGGPYARWHNTWEDISLIDAGTF